MGVPEVSKNGYRYYGYLGHRIREDKNRCIESVPCGWKQMDEAQCKRLRGYGEGGVFCKQHAKKREQECGR